MRAEDKQLLLNIAGHISLAKQGITAVVQQLHLAEEKMQALNDAIKKREET